MEREDFMSVVYDETAEDPTNERANRIIEAADAYAETEVEKALEGTKAKHSSRAAGDNTAGQVAQEIMEAVFEGYIDHPLSFVTGTGENNSFIVSRGGEEFRVIVTKEKEW